MSEAMDRESTTTVAFGDVVQLSKRRSRDPVSDGFDRFLGLEHLEPGDLKIRSWGDIADGTTFTNVFRPGQVLFGKRRSYQRKVAVPDFSGVCSGDIYVLEPKGDHLVPELLPFLCQSESFYDYVISMSQGGLSPRVNWKALEEYEFVLPPQDEQRRIAGLLRSVDALSESLQQLRNAGERCLEAVFEWCVGLRTAEERPGFSKAFGPVPTGWSEVSLVDCCSLITDGEHNTPPRAPAGVPLLSARNVLDRQISYDDVDYVTRETFERLKRRIRPQWGDVLISCSGTIGRVCEVPHEQDLALVRSVAIVRPDANRIDHRYLAEALRSRHGQRQIQSLVGQTAQGNLFQGAIERIVVPVIPLAAQGQLAETCDGQFRSMQTVERRLQELRDLRLAFLQQLFGGQP